MRPKISFMAMILLLALVMILPMVPQTAQGGDLVDYLFSTTQAKLAPAKACTSSTKNLAGDKEVTVQWAGWGHTGDTLVLGFNQMPSNFAGSGSFKPTNCADDSVLFLDTIFGNGAWQYSRLYYFDSLYVANNQKFKAWNKAAHDTIDSFQISIGKQGP